MKPKLAIFAAAAALALPGIALAAVTQEYEGTTNGGGTSKVKVRKNGDVRKVRAVNFKDVPCKNRDAATDFRIFGGTPARVSDSGRFRIEGSSGRTHAVVRGEFNANYKRVRGTLRFRGNRCRTGLVDWRAHR